MEHENGSSTSPYLELIIIIIRCQSQCDKDHNQWSYCLDRFFGSESWPCPGSVPSYQNTCWFSEKHKLQDWMDDPGRLGVSQPKPFVYTSPTKIWLLLSRRERCIFNNCEVILTLIIHWLGSPLFFIVVFRTRASNLEWGLLKAHTRKTPHWEWGSNLQALECRSKIFINRATLAPWTGVDH